MDKIIKKASYHTSCMLHEPTGYYVVSVPRIGKSMKIRKSMIEDNRTKGISYVIDKVLDMVQFKLEEEK